MSKSKRRKKDSAASEPASRDIWGTPLHEWVTAAGLAILIFWRPWQDGIVVPDSNRTFLLGILILFVAWAGRGLLKGQLNVPAVPCFLLAGFIATAWLFGFNSVQYHATQTALTIWCGHAMVFMLAASLRSGTAMGFVLAFVVVSSAAEALWAMIHVKYSLPETRVFVQNNPEAASMLFGHELNAALVHRLNSNRAFGTLLFANGLATWLVATIPIALFGARHAIRKFRAGDELMNPVPKLALGIIAGAFAGVASTPVLSIAHQINAAISAAFPHPVMSVPFSPAMTTVPAAAIAVFAAQLIAIAVAWGIFAVMRLLIKPSSERNQETAADAIIAGILTAATLCIGFAVLYSRFHFYYFAEQATIDGMPQNIRVPIHEPFVPFAMIVFVVPVVAAALAIWITRNRGRATFVWLALAALFALAALWQGSALWMTYSRGGMLALAVGMAVTILLLRPKKADPDAVPLLNAATAALLVLIAAWTVLGGQAHAQDPVAERPTNPFVDEIRIGGSDITVGDMANPTTARLRFSYWGGAFQMALNNAFTGVGLGNFGVAYPQYQSIGINTDTKQAHNDFLQLWCETGIVGLAFFASFWIWFLIAGAKQLRLEKARDRSWWLAAMYASVTGFLAHALVDFPFVDPTLAMLVFLLAGLFWAMARSETPINDQNSTAARAAAAVCLAVAIAVVNISARLGHADAAIGDQQTRQNRFRAASQFLTGMQAPLNKPLTVKDQEIAILVEDPETRRAFGTYYYYPRPNDSTVAPLPPGAPIPSNAIVVLTNMPLAIEKAKEASAGWTTRFAEADAVFPYDPDLAFHISLWLDLLWRSGLSPNEGLAYITQAVEWAERAVERSPRQVAYHDWLCRMLWRRALSEPEVADQLTYYELSLDALDRTVELYPAKAQLWDRHGQVYLWASEKFDERDQADRAEECRTISKESYERAAAIRDELAALANEEES